MIICRLEYKYSFDNEFSGMGNGAYRSPMKGGVLFQASSDLGVNTDCHPNPSEESTLADVFERGIHCCCFADVPALYRWFDCIMKKPIFAEQGQIAFYHVPDECFTKGKYQCIAEMDQLELIEYQPVGFGLH